MSKLIDLTGKKFGRLTVLRRVENHGERAFWRCKCDCGNEKDIAGSALRYGRSTSCGCLPKEIIIKRNTKHGYAHTRIHEIWKSMFQRCYNKNDNAYKNYGGRGIVICDEWRDFDVFKNWAFANGYGDDLSIDRIDVNGNYEPDNCRWADRYVQSNNTRRNVMVKIGEVTHSLKVWCDILRLEYSTVKSRHKKGMDVYKALFTPTKSKNKQRSA